MPDKKFSFDADNQARFMFDMGSEVGIEPETEQGKRRRFTGVAYSGEPITDHWYWKKVIFDLDTIQLAPRIPALLEHCIRDRVGFVDAHTISYEKGLEVSGGLLSNEYGTQVAQDSDGGFPWQMSVKIFPSTIEEVETGSVTVNGKVYQAPITVFRGGRIREISFCALGADENTNAVAASYSPTNKEDTDVTEIETLKAELAARDAKIAELEAQSAQFAADKRDAEIAALQKDLGKEFSADELKNLKDIDDKAFSIVAGQLKQFSATKPKLPAGLTQHQADGGDNPQPENVSKFSAAIQKMTQKKGA